MFAWTKVSASLVGFTLLAATVTIAGAIQKGPCANQAYVERREGVSFQCYSDVAELLRTEQLLGDRLPYLQGCAPSDRPCDEYPTGSMYVMRATSWLSRGSGDPYARFYWTNVLVLLVCGLATVWVLERLGARTFLFAGAPALAMYGTMNWDLIPVALAMVGTLAFLRGKHRPSGVLLGLGGVVKIYPMLLVVPFVMDRLAARDPRGARRVGVAAVATWAVVNVPFAIVAPEGWWSFFRFNADRPADFDSLWRVLCESGACPSTSAVNVISLVGTGVITAVVWRARLRRQPETPTWQMAFPLLVAFLLTNKVWSPQYGLWLLPWFALVAREVRPFLAYQASEVLVFMARFSFFPSPSGAEGIAYGWLAAALVIRTAALAWCLSSWVRSAPSAVRLDLDLSVAGVELDQPPPLTAGPLGP